MMSILSVSPTNLTFINRPLVMPRFGAAHTSEFQPHTLFRSNTGHYFLCMEPLTEVALAQGRSDGYSIVSLDGTLYRDGKFRNTNADFVFNKQGVDPKWTRVSRREDVPDFISDPELRLDTEG